MRALRVSPRDYRDMGTVVDLGPCNICNSISSRWEDITQGLSTKRRLVQSYIFLYTLGGPGAVCWKRSFEENNIRNRGLPRRETPRKTGPFALNPSFVYPQISDVELAGTTRFHKKIL